MSALDATLVRLLLERAHTLTWSLQGLGMLRAYLSRELRLHVWSTAHAVPDVTAIHDHPWDFESTIYSGTLVNRRFYVAPGGAPTHEMATIRCGVGSSIHRAEMGGADPVPVRLVSAPVETFAPGDIYRQQAYEIHESTPADGTVSLIRRTFHRDTEHARVCYPTGQRWVSAEPRPATPDEVRAIVGTALARWNGGGID